MGRISQFLSTIFAAQQDQTDPPPTNTDQKVTIDVKGTLLEVPLPPKNIWGYEYKIGLIQRLPRWLNDIVEGKRDVNAEIYGIVFLGRMIDIAASINAPSIIEYLVNELNADFENVNSRSALHFAAEEGSTEAAEMLLRVGAKVNSRDNHGNTPLDRCMLAGNISTIEVLLQHEANINDKSFLCDLPRVAKARVVLAKALHKHRLNPNVPEVQEAHAALKKTFWER